MGNYYTYVLDDNHVVYSVYENLSEEDKLNLAGKIPFGFSLREFNKPIGIGKLFPIATPKLNVKNVCNIVIFGDEINVRT